MDLGNVRLKPVRTPLVGFGGSEVVPEGMIELPVSLGEEPRRKTCMVQFLVVDSPFAYNVVLGRPGLNKFKAVVSTYHLKMKFPTMQGVREVTCDQQTARQCYNLAVKQGEIMKKEKRKEEMSQSEEAKRGKMKRIEPLEEYKEVELISGNFQKTTHIGSQMTKEMETMMIDFLQSNNDLFAWSPSDFQGINPEVIVHRLNIDLQVKPVKQKKRVFGVERNRIIKEEVNKLLQAGFVREIQYTTWLSNVVIVPKAAGKWRMCTDYTDLNKTCLKDPYPLSRIDLLVDSTTGCALFSMMDAYQGYYQIFMAKEDAEKTASVTEKGVYCYYVMSFGLKNAGATYQRLVNRMFKDHIGSTMEVYVDDMLVKNKQECDHLINLRTAFDIMRSYGMKLNPSKYTFGVRGGKFLGYMVLRKANNFEWNEECEQALQELKLYLTTPPLLSNPMIGEKLYVYLAISDNAIEKLALALVITTRKLRPYFQSHPIVVLTNHPLKQVMSKSDTSGRMIKWAVELGEFDIEFQTRNAIKAQVFADVLVKFAGEQPEKEERWLLHGPDGAEIEIAVRLNFSATNNEAEYEALIQGLQTALDGGIRHVDVYTDSQLVGMQVQGTYETREWSMTQYLVRVKDMMKKFDRCTISQIPKDENMRAEALSRFGSFVEGIKERKITILVKSQPVIDDAEIHVVETADSWKMSFVQYLKYGELPSDAIATKRLQFKANRFTLVGDDLYKRTPKGILLKCLDAERSQYVMKEIHEGSCGNHSGGRSLAQKILRQCYFWPTMVKDANEFARKCESCQKYAGLLHSPATPLEPLKKKFLIVAVEYFSKWVEVEALAKISEKEFQGRKIMAWCKEQKIQQNFTAVGNPQANGEAIIPTKIGEETARVTQYEAEGNLRNGHST
ncbi:UNVERIFIED_CONTAM: Retrovirus-related Pol polyprotein from transposon opus [Sesamum indicum]